MISELPMPVAVRRRVCFASWGGVLEVIHSKFDLRDFE
jgi:hypothetical protein